MCPYGLVSTLRLSCRISRLFPEGRHQAWHSSRWQPNVSDPLSRLLPSQPSRNHGTFLRQAYRLVVHFGASQHCLRIWCSSMLFVLNSQRCGRSYYPRRLWVHVCKFRGHHLTYNYLCIYNTRLSKVFYIFFVDILAYSAYALSCSIMILPTSVPHR